FDIAYHERRIRFLIAAFNWWYPRVGEGGFPRREELDRAKGRLYERIRELGGIVRELRNDTEIRGVIDGLFSGGGVEASKQSGESPKEFVSRHQGKIVALRDRVGSVIRGRLPGVERSLDEDVIELSAPWSEDVRRDLLVRYLGFPFWDILVYPVGALSDVNERDEVEVMRVSPLERRLLLREVGTRDGLMGSSWGHFGASFSRKGRENDYRGVAWMRRSACSRCCSMTRRSPASEHRTPRSARRRSRPSSRKRPTPCARPETCSAI
ncbi:MAG: DUF3376 domain-containing protein, partial [Actinomycetota bacterium]